MEFDKYDKLGNSETPWTQDGTPLYSTVAPEVVNESSQIGTVVIFVISAVLTITLIFALAVFIDCRQQKLLKLQQANRPRRIVRLKIPKIGRTPAVEEDEDTFADKMHLPEPSCSNDPSVIV